MSAAAPVYSQPQSAKILQELLRERILVLDGAMGTMIQGLRPTEADYRGERFINHHKDVKNFNDLLAITRPQWIEDIHTQYLAAGADIIETNSFNATAISMADFDMQAEVREVNLAAAAVARAAVDKMNRQTPDRPRFVAGSIGPTNRTLSISGDVNDPGHRSVTYDQ